ncbi:uncharacterized protein LOC135075530 [Ostrinia nubilalis]|uniref:uncharacterized protein LOC135075530 n=1 Tax=Ostrinia nubilalis TaxID=29057 RepID=UPI0030825831
MDAVFSLVIIFSYILGCVAQFGPGGMWGNGMDHPPPFLPPGGPPPPSTPHHHFSRPSTYFENLPDPPDESYPVQYAGVPQNLQVFPLPLPGADHELMFNVSWESSLEYPARDYSLEVHSVTDTSDCKTPLMCYEYNIPGDVQWCLIPAYANPVAESCAVRPGCSYAVVLTAHPWDGRVQAEKLIQLDECVSGVCSCAHSPRLPAPEVWATTVVMHGEIFVNVTWVLPKPKYPQRLPRDLLKQSYVVSIGKQMVTDAHPAPWFANTITKPVDADGRVADGDGPRWLILPINGKGLERASEGRGGNGGIVLDVKLLARVNLMDDRGCVGPAGNATAYDPSEAQKIQFSTYLVWAVFGGLFVLAMVAIFAMSARIVKRVLSALRPAAPAPLAPLRHRPAWFKLQFRPSAEITARGQVEQSPLYVQKEFETEEAFGDEWEVSRSRVHLGALIGSGAFGRVHAAQLDMPGGETITVAAKMLTGLHSTVLGLFITRTSRVVVVTGLHCSSWRTPILAHNEGFRV